MSYRLLDKEQALYLSSKEMYTLLYNCLDNVDQPNNCWKTKHFEVGSSILVIPLK